jgi:elongation factor P
MQYLYENGDEAVLMDLGDYDQVSLPKSVLGEALDWMLPNDEVDVLFVDERPADVQVPSAVEMAVTQTDPGVRGDTASGGGTKPATLESGVTVQVPLFVNEGDKVRVDTRTREYVARA